MQIHHSCITREVGEKLLCMQTLCAFDCEHAKREVKFSDNKLSCFVKLLECVFIKLPPWVTAVHNQQLEIAFARFARKM